MGYLGKNSIIADNSKYHKSPNGGFYYINEFWFSKAYQKLHKSSMQLLHCLILERKWNNKTKIVLNNGDISFTQIQFKGVFGYSKETYLKARNQLIECGFIAQTYRGGKCRGDMAKYKLLFINGVPFCEQRWREYPEKNWIDEIPKPKKQLIGIGSQWKKGQCGKKKKATLLKDTHNNANDPIKTDP